MKENADELLGKGIKLFEAENYEASLVTLYRAAKLGSSDAMSLIGTIYDDKESFKNNRKAIYWYKRGVESGNSSCAWNLAMRSARKRRLSNYLHWLDVAKQLGDQDAETELKRREWWQLFNA
ncbi:MAG: hypothetical protein QM645_08765 [Asticcacaulis sp.]